MTVCSYYHKIDLEWLPRLCCTNRCIPATTGVLAKAVRRMVTSWQVEHETATASQSCAFGSHQSHCTRGGSGLFNPHPFIFIPGCPALFFSLAGISVCCSDMTRTLSFSCFGAMLALGPYKSSSTLTRHLAALQRSTITCR